MTIRLYKAAVAAAAFTGNEKAARWLKGRQDWQLHMRRQGMDQHPVVWIHTASLGEFEQGRPVLEAIRAAYPGFKILLTFFSPSGYEVRKDYKGADYIHYLPLDTRSNAREFLDIVQPRLAIFIKYEFWYHYLTALHTRKVPTLLVSGIFRPDQVFFKGYGGMFRQLLQQLTHIFVQNRASLQLLEKAALSNASVSGDTRFDRVADLPHDLQQLPLIESFAAGQRLIVAGSTWPEDEQVLAAWWQQQSAAGIKLIIAPHEIHESHITAIRARFQGAVTYTELRAGTAKEAAVLIIDNIGMLTTLYRYAYIAYVGGGFGKDGIHNILEPAAYSKPVVIGPEFKKFAEGVELVALHGALAITDADNLYGCMNRLLTDSAFYGTTAAVAGKYVADNKGATGKIMAYIQENRFLSRE